MGARDIMPLATGQAGVRIQGFPVGANTTAAVAGTSWLEGEVVEITAGTGDIDLTPDGAADPKLGLVFIAAASSEGMLRAKTFGTTTGDIDGLICPVYTFEVGVEFVTRNVVSGSDTNIGPAGDGTMGSVTIGATGDLWRDDTNPGPVSGAINGDFALDIGGNAFTITRILDSQGRDTSVSAGTPDKIVFTLNTIVT